MSLSTLTHTVPTAEPSLPIDLTLEARYSTIEPLNTTIFGDILLARDQMTGERVAIKTVDLSLAFKQQSRANEHVEENVLREVDVLEQVRALGGHPNIVRLHQCYMPVAGQSLHLVLDYCEGGDLYDVCMRAGESTADTVDTADTQQMISGTDGTATAADLEKHISEVEALNYLADVLHGVEFLHAHGIAHRDLSLENILVRRGRAVITDFGLCARQLPRTQRFECAESVGKQYYMAPEVVDRQVYDPRCADVWSLGIALFILLTSSPPFDSAKSTDGGFRYVAARGIKPVFQAWGLADKISVETQDLVARMLVVDPRLRITVADMWRHPALAGCRRRSSN